MQQADRSLRLVALDIPENLKSLLVERYRTSLQLYYYVLDLVLVARPYYSCSTAITGTAVPVPRYLLLYCGPVWCAHPRNRYLLKCALNFSAHALRFQFLLNHSNHYCALKFSAHLGIIYQKWNICLH